LSSDDLIFRQSTESVEEVPKERVTSPAPYQIQGAVPAPVEDASSSPFLFYSSGEGSVKVWVLIEGETVWASQKGMSEIFDIEPNTVGHHLKNIFESNELEQESVTRKFRATAADNKSYETTFYNLDAVISVGYRVNSYRATQFRRWATEVLKSYLIKGYSLNDDRLKQGSKLFAKDYFRGALPWMKYISGNVKKRLTYI